MLAHDKVFFADPSLFNDPFDCSIIPEYDYRSNGQCVSDFQRPIMHLKKMNPREAEAYINKKLSENKERFLQTMRHEFKAVVLRGFGVYSLSAVNDDILMWSHYADSHTGFCLEFLRTKDNLMSGSETVNYPDDNEYPDLRWPRTKVETFETAKRIVLTKAKHWCYEQEWRMIDRPDIATENYVGHERQVPDNLLTGIIFGVRMPKENRNVIRKVLAGKDIKYKEAVLKKNRFELEIVPWTGGSQLRGLKEAKERVESDVEEEIRQEEKQGEKEGITAKQVILAVVAFLILVYFLSA